MADYSVMPSEQFSAISKNVLKQHT